jgi:succinate dehydrogenase/fumarate reductase flavoprotein subunit
MDIENFKSGKFNVNCYNINTLIVGSGAAALNAAVSLHGLGQKDIIIATAGLGNGTSNNAGSDKQTYYKLSLCGDEPDSVIMMAKDLYSGKCMHGDIALCEAQGSVQAFMRLAELGVPFPHDKFGSWAGYKTDHDPRARATSTGPYTSKKMYEALIGEVRKRKIKVLNNHQVIALLTDRKRSRVIGAFAINKKERDYLKAFVIFNSTNVILGTGGPGGLYKDSVYPLSQQGSTGMAFKAGASGQNLTESQFGIGSVKFRWNLSGSYQQVIPRYFSTDKSGNNEKEFLNDVFPDKRSLSKAIFLKGYQWPFDPRKISSYGSSLIDLLVYRERTELNRRVFIDFTRNPSWGGNDKFIPDDLDDEVYDYLSNSDSFAETPVKRLQAMNPASIALYKDNGIDLTKEPLEIAVCAQHNNGGLKGDIWWESDLKHLFPVGEVNGSHGVYRPGGSALNSGQVGSRRAAQFICGKYHHYPPPLSSLIAEAGTQVTGELEQAERWMSSGSKGVNSKYFNEIRSRMTAGAGILRSGEKILKASKDAAEMLKHITGKAGAASVKDLAEAFLLTDQCLTHFVYLEAVKAYIENGGRSRGSFLIDEPNGSQCVLAPGREWRFNICEFDRKIENHILEVKFCNSALTYNLQETREIPAQNLWFEKVWKDYLSDNYF